ncbi:MAG: hypothetical protein IR164_09930 [Devosia sp.]|uniref:hypothetical protein n=1 Tax=Devosia sp. TaxID=1871048 RepID=UPI001A0C7752|nr:hypothetical protein [Devosia sp.]MBF0679244.1 hypothetical protein [Devosia sp.]
MKIRSGSSWLRSRAILAVATLSVSMATLSLAWAQERGQFFATQEDGYGRLIISFPGRDTLPAYDLRMSNSVLTLTFEDQIAIALPDVASTMPEYLSVARVDADGKGMRLALRTNFNFNPTEAGDKLFIDLLPQSWQGMPPALPQDVIDEMAAKAVVAALREDQMRKAQVVAEQNPRATVRLGRNPTFYRLQFDWTIPTGGTFDFADEAGAIEFEWPVEVDMREARIDLPREIADIRNVVTPDGSTVSLKFAKGVEPRFYGTSPTQYVLDIDIEGEGLPELTPAALLSEQEALPVAAASLGGAPAQPVAQTLDAAAPAQITPFVTMLGSTVRVVFPFEQETPAAVFRRGDSVWMVFDSQSQVASPPEMGQLQAIASEFVSSSSGNDTQVVRIDLSQDRLATLGSEGLSWVLSLGDVMLAPTEPVELVRRRDMQGEFEMTANIVRPARVHDFADPMVGDTLKVVTAYPPARGLTRSFDYVDFAAMRSVHGLVVRPKAADLDVEIENALAVISSGSGLTVSPIETLRQDQASTTPAKRANFLDLAPLVQADPGIFGVQRDQYEALAAASDGVSRDTARLDLGLYFLANGLALEALGVFEVAGSSLRDSALRPRIEMSLAAASVVAGRPADGLATLNDRRFDQDVDAMFWRAIARTAVNDFSGALADATQAYSISDGYPSWLRAKFQLAAIRAAVEERNEERAAAMLESVDFADLDTNQIAEFNLLTGRLAQAQGRQQLALDTYGQVIASEVRPSRAEAVYRTLQILDQQGRLDVARGTQTLSAEAMLWRGDRLEASMQAMLADLHFRTADYREGFEAVKAAILSDPESREVQVLSDSAQRTFTELFLHGMADKMAPVDALGVYYDFQHLTPAGAQGDEMIRNLARRLVRVDLLPQAIDLLQYQLDNRLRGVARTQVATDLAVLYLANHKPAEAMRVLNESRLPDLPVSMARQRRIIEARALIDGGRDQLALDLLRDLEGQDIELMRIDAHWQAKRYVQAGQGIEALYGMQALATPLSKPARLNIIQAGVGYVLVGDAAATARLRAKYSDAMVNSPEWPIFDFITGPIEVTSNEFKQVAAQIAARDGLDLFLTAYRETYESEGALAPVAKTDELGLTTEG